MKKTDIKKFLQSLNRKADSNKYDYGHILVIAGSQNMPGAGNLCCNAAMRAGAGLVTYAVKEDFFTFASVKAKSETMFFIYKRADEILKFIKLRKVSSVIIGPGLEINEENRKIIIKILNSITLPTVLDASGITVFNGKTKELKKAKAKIVITPHEGEFSKLTNQNIKLIKEFKEKIVAKFAKENSCICVLKGNKTIISNGLILYKNDLGTPALATAGSGDVLSGIIAAFASINNNLFEVAKFAVFVHSTAGKLAEKDKGICGVIASDIVENVPYAMKQILENREG